MHLKLASTYYSLNLTNGQEWSCTCAETVSNVAVVGIPNASALATGDVDSATANGGIGLDPVFQSWSHLWSLDVTGEQDQYYNMTQVQI